MVRDNYITQKLDDDAIKEVKFMQFSQNTAGIKAPHFVFYVKQLLVNQFGENMVERGGLQVKTTLDYKIEENAENIVKEEIAKDKSLNVGNGAAMVTNPKTGEILAMVGKRGLF
jgi:membrane peptidoglycan carboxypeptidase